MTITRYALYYLPPAGAKWAEFATRWLGRDIRMGVPVEQPQIAGLPLPVADITETPRRYGLHATLKPPFRLAGGQNLPALEKACSALCASLSPVRLEGLKLAQMGRFLALRPVGPEDEANALAAVCVRDLDRFRAPPDPRELARRGAGSLPPALAANLLDWGFAYVMDAFRFHITLTGKLSKPDLAAVKAVLLQDLAPLLPSPLHLNELGLVGEDTDGQFHLLNRFALTG